MHVVIWTAGDDRYAIASDRIAEVVPVVQIRSLPRCPAWLCGLMDYRGALAPVVDMTLLVADRPSARHRAARILVVRLRGELEGEMLGLLVETLESVEDCAFEGDHTHRGVKAPDAPYLSAVGMAAGGMVQLVEVEALLGPEHRALLFDRAEKG